MLELRPGRITGVLPPTGGCQECWVSVDGRVAPALAYPDLTGSLAPGDDVWVNVAALARGLGTGGHHFIAWGPRPPLHQQRRGHILKWNYTPWQVPVLSVEEPASPHHAALVAADDLGGMPVVALELHSQLGAVAAGVRIAAGAQPLRLVYVMVEGGALPLAYSRQVAWLRRVGLLSACITCGHTLGGDLEAVNLFSGLLAARHVLGGHVAVVGIGPGQVGTGTAFGFSGVQQGLAVNAAHTLGGRPVAALRIDFADRRPRHRGVSHHSLTALGRVALVPADVPLPSLPPHQAEEVRRPLAASAGFAHHRLVEVDAAPALQLLQELQAPLSTMGRRPAQSPEFFLAAAAAGIWAADLAAGRKAAPVIE